MICKQLNTQYINVIVKLTAFLHFSPTPLFISQELASMTCERETNVHLVLTKTAMILIMNVYIYIAD